ncbi:hypothetical protein GCM10009759_74210 [Kitasatospora saccharophila]|uniref:Uncharacterized protein n=1 Tax=Kitasatospora saccharophila TaxID=407973 RepID=A0ABN2Y892_9ACTN
MPQQGDGGGLHGVAAAVVGEAAVPVVGGLVAVQRDADLDTVFGERAEAAGGQQLSACS